MLLLLATLKRERRKRGRKREATAGRARSVISGGCWASRSVVEEWAEEE